MGSNSIDSRRSCRECSPEKAAGRSRNHNHSRNRRNRRSLDSIPALPKSCHSPGEGWEYSNWPASLGTEGRDTGDRRDTGSDWDR